MNYGLPYMGSKNKIAKKIVELLPSGKRLVDLMAGGCAITHCALLSGKWNQVLANDINAKIIQLFKDAVEGKFENEKRWISREDFLELRDKDEFVKVCWSFGNNRTTYLYSKKIEQYKKACHYAVVFDDWSEFEKLCPEKVGAAREALKGMPVGTWQERKARRLKFGPSIVNEVKRLRLTNEQIEDNPLYKSIKNRWSGKGNERLERLESLERVERLSALQSLEDLERIERLQGMANQQMASFSTSSLPYEAVQLKEGDVVYADPPYEGTYKGFTVEFDHERFWNWCRCQAKLGVKVFVSEYNAPDDFIEVFRVEKARLGAGGTSAKYGNAIEKVFVHNTFKKEN